MKCYMLLLQHVAADISGLFLRIQNAFINLTSWNSSLCLCNLAVRDVGQDFIHILGFSFLQIFFSSRNFLLNITSVAYPYILRISLLTLQISEASAFCWLDSMQLENVLSLKSSKIIYHASCIFQPSKVNSSLTSSCIVAGPIEFPVTMHSLSIKHYGVLVSFLCNYLALRALSLHIQVLSSPKL